MAEIIRSLVEKVVLTPHESENRLVADLHGDLAGILAMSVSTKGGRAIDADALARHRATLGLTEAGTFGVDSVEEVLVAGGRPHLNLLYENKDKLVEEARNQLILLVFSPDISAWRYAS